MSQSDDVVALWRLQSAYADLVSRRAWDELHELFLPDTAVHLDTVTGEPRTLVGPDEFGEFVAGAVEHYDLFLFVILNTVVDIDAADPAAATGRIFMCEIRHDPASDTWHNAYGLYQDRYTWVGGRWRFAERHYRSLGRTGPTPAVFDLPPT